MGGGYEDNFMIPALSGFASWHVRGVGGLSCVTIRYFGSGEAVQKGVNQQIAFFDPAWR